MDRDVAPTKPQLLAMWIASGIVLVLFLNAAPVQRTQEARVMETAREMHGRPLHDWLIPKLNGEVRLRKPPLAYWLSAAGFEAVGVKPWVARLPMALAGWLTIGITYAFAARAFDRFTGLLAAAALLGSYMFYRYTRLAETDALAMLFVTLAIWAIWRGSESPRAWMWFHLSAVGIALAILSKGLPAIFPEIFLVAFAWVEHRWNLIWRWVRSGAPITLAIIALPWFAYVWNSPESKQLADELKVVAVGGEHGSPSWEYIPQVLLATLPWTPMAVIGIVSAAKRWRSDARARMLLIWCLTIFVPLCIAPQRQRHYLLPLMPPLMILAGWAIAQLRAEIRRGLVPFLAVSIVGMVVFAGVIFPRMFERDPQAEAREILSQFPDANFYFAGGNESLPLCFAMRREIPILRSDAAALAVGSRDPGAILIVLEKPDRYASPPPAPFVEASKLEGNDRIARLYKVQSLDGGGLTPPSTSPSTAPSGGGK